MPRTKAATRPSTLCGACGDELRATKAVHAEIQDDIVHVVRNAPADICLTCGEIRFDDVTLRRIERLIREGRTAPKFTRLMRAYLYDFPPTG